jgi:predicted ATPase
MITRVRLQNFRSIAECDVELGPLTILVGPNGSGKSNFLHALDFVSDALNNGIESAVRRRGGMNSLLSRWTLDDPDATMRIGVELTLTEGRSGMYSIALRRSTAGGYVLHREHCQIVVTRDRGLLAKFDVKPEGSEWHDIRGVQYVPGVFPSLGLPSLTLPHTAEHLNFGLVYRALRGIASYSPHVAGIRKPQEFDGGERLAPDGSNLASVLSRMLEINTYGVVPAERIVDWMQVIAPGIESIRATSVSGYVTLQFEQRSGENDRTWTFDARDMSYGTLRALCVLVALYQGRMRDISPVTLVGIEEPESAVHPGAATVLLEAMNEASLVTQVLATTHSATMLDHEDLDIDIVRGVARIDGRTIIGPVDAASRQILSEALSSAGELLRMGHLTPDEASDSPSDFRIVTPA